MPNSRNNFVWHDLMTTDTKAAEAFYSKVVGWRAQDAGMPDRSYIILHANEIPIGGLMPVPPETAAAGATPFWNGYVAVDDVDAFAKRVTQAGGAVHRGPEDIPGVGRFAVVADPHANLDVVQGLDRRAAATPAPGTPVILVVANSMLGTWASLCFILGQPDGPVEAVIWPMWASIRPLRLIARWAAINLG